MNRSTSGRSLKRASAALAAALGLCAIPGAAQAMVFHTAFGGPVSGVGNPGNPDGQFSGPQGLGVDMWTNTVFVADSNDGRIQHFDRQGAFLGKWTVNTPGGGVGNPVDVAADDQRVWVIEQASGVMRRYSTQGVLAATGTQDISVGSSAAGVTLDAIGTLYNSSYGFSHLRRYDRTADTWTLGLTWGTAGTGAGQLARPLGVATSPDGQTIYVAERDANRVQRFSRTGVAQGQIGSAGSGDGQMSGPNGVAVDPRNGDVWVADTNNKRVERFKADGTFVEALSTTGGPGVQTFTPRDVGVDAEGYLYVLDSQNSRVIVFKDAPPPPPNRNPTPAPDALTTAEDTAGTVNVLPNDTDPDGDPLTVTGVTQPAHGSVTCTPAGGCTYTPSRDYNGPDRFTYVVSDGRGGTASASVDVTVTPVDDPVPPPPPAPPAPPAPASTTTKPPVLVVGAPRTLTVGPATVQAPRTVSLAGLRAAKCVNVRVTARRPITVNVTIYSGRRSLRLFGQKSTRFTRPGTRVLCVPVPARARTFRPRDGLTLDIRSAGLRRVGLSVTGVSTRRVPIAVAP